MKIPSKKVSLVSYQNCLLSPRVSETQGFERGLYCGLTGCATIKQKGKKHSISHEETANVGQMGPPFCQKYKTWAQNISNYTTINIIPRALMLRSFCFCTQLHTFTKSTVPCFSTQKRCWFLIQWTWWGLEEVGLQYLTYLATFPTIF